MDRKLLSGVLGVILLLSLFSSCDRPQKSGIDFDQIDTSGDPVQQSLPSDDPILIETKGGHFTLTSVAEYQLSGMVVSKKTYSYGWEAEISPVDLAIVWGKLTEPEHEKNVSFSQRDRWYFYEYKPESPLDHTYIISHSSNNHIIPANENISLALKTVKKKEKIILKGLLVNVEGSSGGQPVTWKTSFTRTDTGNGSCELIYVTKVRIDTDVYE
jgi:hypothetical protein